MQSDKFGFVPDRLDLSSARCCGYLRRSREDREAEAEGELKTLEKHKDILTWTAEDYSATVAEWYQEVSSGATIDNREQMLRLMRDMADGKWDAVFVKEASRLGRGSGVDQDKIINVVKHSKTLIVTPGKLYHYASKSDMKLLRKELQDSSSELDVSTERLQDGLDRGIKRGCYYGIEPYGWKKERIKRNWTLVPHPVNHERLVLMYDLVDKYDYSTTQIKRHFESQGWPSPKGNTTWTKNTIRTILYNPLNKGVVSRGKHKTVEVLDKETFLTTKKRVVLPDGEYIKAEGLHIGEGTIDPEKWERVVNKIKGFSTCQEKRPIKNPLAGILRCGNCHYAMILRPRNSKDPEGKSYRHFVHYDEDPKGCDCKTAQYHVVMEALLSTLKALWGEQEVMLSNEGKKHERERRLNQVKFLEEELDRLRDERKRIHLAFHKGMSTEEESDAYLAENSIATKNLEAELASALADLPSEDEIKAKMATIAEIIATIEDEKIPPAEMNRILREFIEYIDYFNYAPRRKRKNDIVLEIKLRD